MIRRSTRARDDPKPFSHSFLCKASESLQGLNSAPETVSIHSIHDSTSPDLCDGAPNKSIHALHNAGAVCVAALHHHIQKACVVVVVVVVGSSKSPTKQLVMNGALARSH
jgi:hypothetical protein